MMCNIKRFKSNTGVEEGAGERESSSGSYRIGGMVPDGLPGILLVHFHTYMDNSQMAEMKIKHSSSGRRCWVEDKSRGKSWSTQFYQVFDIGQSHKHLQITAPVCDSFSNTCGSGLS